MLTLTFIDDPAGTVQWVRPHPREGVPKREPVYGVAAVEFLRVIHIVQVDVPPIAHNPLPRGHVEVSRDLEEQSTNTIGNNSDRAFHYLPNTIEQRTRRQLFVGQRQMASDY